MAKLIKCSFTSVWDSGESITTPCTYDPKTGEVTPESSDAAPEGVLEREYITIPNTMDTDDDEVIEVCTTCHEYIMKAVMVPGVGHDINEELECSNPECDNKA